MTIKFLKVGAEPHYSYNYKRVTAAPRTPERVGREFSSLASTASTAPPTPVVIQRGLPDSERQMIQNQFDNAAQKRRLDSAENRKTPGKIHDYYLYILLI